jgi:hypothetical protein
MSLNSDGVKKNFIVLPVPGHVYDVQCGAYSMSR